LRLITFYFYKILDDYYDEDEKKGNETLAYYEPQFFEGIAFNMIKIIPDFTNRENKKLYILKIIIIFIHEISKIKRLTYGSSNNPLLDSPMIVYYSKNKKEIGEIMHLLIGVF